MESQSPEGNFEGVLRGAIWSGAGWLLSLASSLPLAVILVRALPHTTYGSLALATAIITLMTAVADFGLRAAIAQMSASDGHALGRSGSSAIASVGRFVALRLTALLIIVCGVTLLIMHEVPTLRASFVPMACMLPMLLITPVRSALTGIMQSEFAIKSVTLSGVTQAIVILLATGAILLAGSRSAAAIAGARSLGALISLGVLGWGGFHWIKRSKRATHTKQHVRRLINLSWGMLLAGIAWAAIAQLDVLILGIERGPKATAFYSPISTIGNFVMALPAVIGTYLLPALTVAAGENDSRKVARLYHDVSRWSIAVTAPALGVMIVVPESTLRLLFGQSFGAYGGTARVLGIGMAVNILFGFNGMALEAYGLPGVVARRSLIGIAVSVVVCPVLVEYRGITGAALATSAAIILINLQCSLTLRRRFGILPFDRKLGLVVLLFVGTCLGLIVGTPHGSDLLQVLFVGASIGLVTGGCVLVLYVAEKRGRRGTRSASP